MIDYLEIPAPFALSCHIKCLWRLTGHASAAVAPEPIVPDGCMEIVLNLGDPFVRSESGVPAHVQPRRLVAGQLTRTATIAPTGRVNVWGIRFHPWSAASFLGVAAFELRDHIVDLASVAPRVDRSLHRVVDIAEPDRLAFLMKALGELAAPVQVPDPRVVGLVEVAAQRRDVPSVRRLANEAGVSSRRVQMVFRDAVGLSPKQLLRITRFQRALALGRSNPELSWGRIAANAGYHDHAHLLHESRIIAGCPPSAILGRDDGLTSAFLSDDSRL